MILAIESCHKLGFIHRDIKPDVSISSGSLIENLLKYDAIVFAFFSFQ
jgi:serine/threonine protein kinase